MSGPERRAAVSGPGGNPSWSRARRDPVAARWRRRARSAAAWVAGRVRGAGPRSVAALVGWLAAVVPFARQLDLQGYDGSTIVPVLAGGGAALALAVLVGGSVPSALAVAGGTAVTVLSRTEVPLAARALFVGLSTAWAVATGLVALPSSIRHRARPGLVPLVAATVVLALRPGIVWPTALVAAAAAVAAPGVVVARRAVPIAEPAVDGPPEGDVVPATAARVRGGRRRALTERLARSPLGALHRGARRVGRALGAVAMVPGSVIVTLLWAGRRLVRYDPEPRSDPTTTWRARTDLDTTPAHLFTKVRLPQGRPLARRVHHGVALLVSALLAVTPGIVDTFRGRIEPPSTGGGGDFCNPERLPPDPAMDGQAGWPELGCEIGEYSLAGRFDAIASYRFEDYDGEHLDVRDGVRDTWRPPDCDCPRLRVWWFGGSFAWGWNQRDDFTPASQLAKAAWADGIALDIENRAVPGWTLGQEARTFAHLTTTEALPDLVVFVDGGNDVNLQRERNRQGRGADESETSFAEVEMDDLLANGPRRDGPDAAAARPPTRWPRPGSVDDGAVGRHAAARYRRNVAMARRLADHLGVPALFAWQPVLPAAPRSVGNPDALGDDAWPGWVAALDAARSQLPAEVIDLSDSLDRPGRIVYRDPFHVNEHGADLVARELYRRVAPTLARVARDVGGEEAER